MAPTWVIAACKMGPRSGESLRLAPVATSPSGMPAASGSHRPLAALFAAVDRGAAGDLATAGRLGDTAVSGHAGDVQADDPVVGLQPQGVEPLGEAGGGPLLEASADRAV